MLAACSHSFLGFFAPFSPRQRRAAPCVSPPLVTPRRRLHEFVSDAVFLHFTTFRDHGLHTAIAIDLRHIDTPSADYLISAHDILPLISGQQI